MKSNSYGFTLVELLVVIAIVAILAGILTPALQSTREKANKIKCMSNARQIGLAVQYHLEDHDQYYPFTPKPTDGCYNKTAYMNYLGSNYFKANFEVFKCPSNKNTSGGAYRTNSLGRMDFEFNSGLVGNETAGSGPAPATGTNWAGEAIVTPANCVVFTEFPIPTAVINDPAQGPASHVDGGANTCFADGHIAWVPREQWSGYSVEGQVNWWKWGRAP